MDQRENGMDPVNILLGVNLIASGAANMSGARKGIKDALSQVKLKPQSYLQTWPQNILAVILVLQVLGIFQIGTLDYAAFEELTWLRLLGLAITVVFSWMQVAVYKSLGSVYTTEAVILKNHKLKTDGYYKLIRHPQYLFQLIADIGAGIALLSWLVLPAVLLVALPLVILRARLEERILREYFKEEFDGYKKRSGFFIPWLG